MAKKTSLLEDIFDITASICFHLPAWAIPVVSLSITFVVHIAVLMVFGAFANMGVVFPQGLYLIIVSGTFALTSLAGYVGWKRRDKRKALLTTTQSLGELKSLDWHAFELLVAEIYRSKGFKVTEMGGNGPDGGIDLIAITPQGSRQLIQCKHWRSAKVGVKVVREMLGVLAKEGGQKAVVIATGAYTKEALRFAEGQPIELIDGPSLLKCITAFNATTSDPSQKPTPSIEPQKSIPQPVEPISQICPTCGAKLTRRVAKRGPNVGNAFLGCSSFPKCRYTAPLPI